MNETRPPNNRRIFIKSQDRICQLFSFEQTDDGSIYCAFPDFSTAEFLSVSIIDGRPQIVSTESLGIGKISFHASGMVGVRPNDDPKGYKVISHGNYLLIRVLC